jgi:nucleoid DNA-binding protein
MTKKMNYSRAKIAAKVWEAVATNNCSFAHMVSPTDMSTFILYLFEQIEKLVLEGHDLEFRGFGTFKRAVRKARIGRNPRHPEVVIEVPEKYVMAFRASKQLNKKFEKVVK